jgi:hypothetical protein
MKYLGQTTIEVFQAVTQINRPNGRIAIQLANGKYFGIGPSGVSQEAIMIGVWEEALLTSKGLLYDGSGDPSFNGRAYLRVLL